MSIEMQFIPKAINLENNVDDVTIDYSNNNAPLTRTPITVQNEIVKKVESYKAPKPVFGKSTVFDSLFK